MTLQTITAAEHASTLLGTPSTRTMKPDNLILFIMEKVQHHIINDGQMKTTESVLTALGKKQKARKQQSKKSKKKSASGVTCENCKNLGHTKADCWLRGGGKEDQGQEDKILRKRRRRQKQLLQQKQPAMQMKYSHLPGYPTMLKSQIPSMFPSPNLVHALIVVQVDATALTAMHSSTILQSAIPPSPLPMVANPKCSEREMSGSSYQTV